MKKILIVGAGGMGRELFSWLLNDSRYGKEWIVKGFLIDQEKGNQKENDPIFKYDVPVITLSEYILEVGDIAMLAIGDPIAKRKVTNNVKQAGLTFETYIHNSVIIGQNTTIGKGTVICPNVVISCDTTIENYVTINLGSTVGHDAIIKDYTTLSSHVDITGNCFVDEDVFMGSHAALVPVTKVGKNAKVAAGSIGIRRVKDGTTILGVPGKKFEIK